MITARELYTQRVVTGTAEERLRDLAPRVRQVAAHHCVVLEANGGRFLGVIRLADVVGRSEAGKLILADLISDVRPLVAQADEPAQSIAALFERHALCEAVVLDEDGGFEGLLTAESVFGVLQAEHRAARVGLELLLSERQQMNHMVEELVARRTADLTTAIDELKRTGLALANDLTGPLRSIRQYAELLRSQKSGSLSADGEFYVESIRWITERLERVAADLIARSRETLAGAVAASETIDLNRIFTDACEFHRALIHDRRATVRKRAPLHAVRARYVPVLQVVANLIAGAIRQTPVTREPVVEVWSEETDDGVILHVHGNGRVPYRAETAAFFEPFGPDSPLDEFGLRLGLAIARSAATDVGGAVDLHPVPDDGTVFTARLQRARVAD